MPVSRHLVTAALAALLLTGAAAASAGSAGAGTQRLRLTADPQGAFRFNTTRLSAHAGKVTVVMSNPSTTGLTHGIAVQGRGVDKDGPRVAAGGTSRVTVTLKKGTYTFYCPVDGHRGLGMHGTIVVR
jgi:uncharacterized cupredoxin-like copper-binding protein